MQPVPRLSQLPLASSRVEAETPRTLFAAPLESRAGSFDRALSTYGRENGHAKDGRWAGIGSVMTRCSSLLTVLILVAARGNNGAASNTAPTNPPRCPDVAIYGVRGSGQDYTPAEDGMGPEMYKVGQQPQGVGAEIPGYLRARASSFCRHADSEGSFKLSDLTGTHQFGCDRN